MTYKTPEIVSQIHLSEPGSPPLEESDIQSRTRFLNHFVEMRDFFGQLLGKALTPEAQIESAGRIL